MVVDTVSPHTSAKTNKEQKKRWRVLMIVLIEDPRVYGLVDDIITVHEADSLDEIIDWIIKIGRYQITAIDRKEHEVWVKEVQIY